MLACSRLLVQARLPVQFVEKAMMHIHTAVPIGVGFIAAMWAPEQLAPGLFDALAASIGEPLPLGAAARAILTGPMWIDLDRDHLLNVGFVFGVFSDLAAQLVRTPAVHAP